MEETTLDCHLDTCNDFKNKALKVEYNTQSHKMIHKKIYSSDCNVQCTCISEKSWAKKIIVIVVWENQNGI